MMIEERIRTAARLLRQDIDGPVPNLQHRDRHPGRLVAVGGLLVAVSTSAAVIISRDDSAGTAQVAAPIDTGRPVAIPSATDSSTTPGSVSATAPATSLTPEGDVDVGSLGRRDVTLDADEWVLLETQPAGYRFLWAKREGSSRTAMYGDDSGNTINLDVSTDRAEDPVAPTVDVAGDVWFIEQTQPGFVLAARFVGDSYVSLSANGAATPEQVTTLLSTLVTVDNDAVPGDLLAPTDDKFHDVATFDFMNDTIVMSAYGVNKNFCTRLTSPDHNSSGCVETLDVDGVMSSALGAYSSHVLGSATERVVAHGIVRADVALVTVRLVDGQTFDLSPTDASGRFDVRFWLLAADIAPTDGAVVTRIAAYDARGALLAVQE